MRLEKDADDMMTLAAKLSAIAVLALIVATFVTGLALLVWR